MQVFLSCALPFFLLYLFMWNCIKSIWRRWNESVIKTRQKSISKWYWNYLIRKKLIEVIFLNQKNSSVWCRYAVLPRDFYLIVLPLTLTKATHTILCPPSWSYFFFAFIVFYLFLFPGRAIYICTKCILTHILHV